MSATVRRLRISDLSHVVQLLHQLWPGQSVGFCSLSLKDSLWVGGRLGHVDELVVEESRRRQGIGHTLVQAVEEDARRLGCKRLELDSATHRAEAHEFYESQRFERRAYLFSKVLRG